MTAPLLRLVTRSDFDGLVCGMLLREKGLIDDIKFVHPKDMQDGLVPITGRDIVTGLPYVPGCHLAPTAWHAPSRPPRARRAMQVLTPARDCSSSVPMEPEIPTRKIIHVDMDAFYASVEQRDDPALRGRPIAVGGSRERGVVAAASYEARRFGVRSAMPSVTARRLCPELHFVSPRFDVYKAVSATIRTIFERYTDVIEPLSLDEAYLDVTEDHAGLGSATAIAQAIRTAIRAETGLTASAGVSYNKFLAKLASDHNKPDGLCVVTPRQGEAFVAALPVGRFHGVGPVTAAKMARLGIGTGADLKAQSLAFLQAEFGKSADYYFWAARGHDDRPVRAHRVRKSVGAERTFSTDLSDEGELVAALEEIGRKVWERVASGGSFGRTVTLKVKYDNFRQLTRAHSQPAPVLSAETMMTHGTALLRDLCPVERGVRLLGLTVSGFGDAPPPVVEQLGLGI